MSLLNTAEKLYLGTTEAVKAYLGTLLVWPQVSFLQLLKNIFTNDPTIVGAIYDPNDLGSVFQDQYGTTPCTAQSQPVALFLDVSKNLEYGPELFDYNNITVIGAGTVVANAEANTVQISDGGAWRIITPLAQGKFYDCQFDILEDNSTGTLAETRFSLSGASPSYNGTFIQSPGHYRYIVQGGGANDFRWSSRTSNTNILFGNLTMRELKGEHLFQSNNAAVPTLRAEYSSPNLSPTGFFFEEGLPGWLISGYAVHDNGGAIIGDGNGSSLITISPSVSLPSSNVTVRWRQTVLGGTRGRVRIRNFTNSGDIGPFSYYAGNGTFEVSFTSDPNGFTLSFYAPDANSIVRIEGMEIHRSEPDDFYRYFVEVDGNTELETSFSPDRSVEPNAYLAASIRYDRLLAAGNTGTRTLFYMQRNNTNYFNLGVRPDISRLRSSTRGQDNSINAVICDTGSGSFPSNETLVVSGVRSPGQISVSANGVELNTSSTDWTTQSISNAHIGFGRNILTYRFYGGVAMLNYIPSNTEMQIVENFLNPD